MQERLFRKKSVERVSSPEQLNDYMRVTSPAVWMILGAAIVLLAGLVILASVRPLETTLPVKARVIDGGASVVLPLERAGDVREGMPLRVAGQEAVIDAVYEDEAGQAVCAARVSAADGLYDGEIVTESLAPIRFLLN